MEYTVTTCVRHSYRLYVMHYHSLLHMHGGNIKNKTIFKTSDNGAIVFIQCLLTLIRDSLMLEKRRGREVGVPNPLLSTIYLERMLS